MRADILSSVEAYLDKVGYLAAQAANQGAQLIAFPDFSAAPLLGTLPDHDERNSPDRGEATVLRLLEPLIARTHWITFQSLARLLRVYIYSGSTLLLYPDGRIGKVAYLFGPDGRVMARGQQSHVSGRERNWGLSAAGNLTVANTVLGGIGLPMHSDADYWEAFRILYLLGADIAVLPTHSRTSFPTSGLWYRIQESPMYGVQACLVGGFLGQTLSGSSSILGPMDLSKRRDGIWAQAQTDRDDDVVVAAVDVAALHEWRNRQRIDQSFNPTLYGRYFPTLYQKFQASHRRRRRGRRSRGKRVRRPAITPNSTNQAT